MTTGALVAFAHRATYVEAYGRDAEELMSLVTFGKMPMATLGLGLLFLLWLVGASIASVRITRTSTQQPPPNSLTSFFWES